jgi:hypothetical protein
VYVKRHTKKRRKRRSWNVLYSAGTHTLLCVCSKIDSRKLLQCYNRQKCCFIFYFILNVVLAGTMVIVEKALLLDEFKESHCHHCLHWTPGPVPCRQCSQVSPSFFLHLVPHFTFKNAFLNREILFGVDANERLFHSLCGYSCVKSR